VVVEPATTDDLFYETILSDPFVVVVGPTHRLAAQKSVRWAALDGERMVLLDHSSGSRRLIDSALERFGANCRVMQQVGHPTTVFRMVEAGIGISVMPRLSLPPAGLSSLVALPLKPAIARSIMLAHRRNRAPSPLAQVLWQIIQDVAKTL
jgi:DNA-binding transcriptional LysR family regulator